jgi:hypothetical protein
MKALGQLEHGGLRFLGCEVTGAKLVASSRDFYESLFAKIESVA